MSAKPLTKSEVRAMVADWPFQEKAQVKAKVQPKAVNAEVRQPESKKDRILKQTLADFLGTE